MAESKKKAEELKAEDLQAMVKAILEEAKAEAAKIVEEAKAAVGQNTGMTPEEREAHEAYMNELVEVKLFKDSGKYKDDVFVSVNGETVLIQRGVRVKIKRKFAEALDNSELQDYETAELITRKVKEGEKSAKDAGL